MFIQCFCVSSFVISLFYPLLAVQINEYINFEESLRDQAQTLQVHQKAIIDSFREISKQNNIQQQQKSEVANKIEEEKVQISEKNVVPEAEKYVAAVDSSQHDSSEQLPTILIGIGTGRCGTMAFSKLVDAQPNTKVTHESEYCNDYKWFDASGIDGAYYAKLRYQRYMARAKSKKGTGRVC